MSDLEQMYQQVIMDHAKRGRGKGLVDAQSRRIGESHQVNTTCGDEVTLRVGLNGEHIDSLSWEGAGCSISQASVSAMTEILADTDIDTFEEAFDAFRELMHSRGEPLDDEHLEAEAYDWADALEAVERRVEEYLQTYFPEGVDEVNA